MTNDQMAAEFSKWVAETLQPEIGAMTEREVRIASRAWMMSGLIRVKTCAGIVEQYGNALPASRLAEILNKEVFG